MFFNLSWYKLKVFIKIQVHGTISTWQKLKEWRSSLLNVEPIGTSTRYRRTVLYASARGSQIQKSASRKSNFDHGEVSRVEFNMQRSQARMRHLFSLFACLSAPAQKLSSPFWDDIARVSQLDDPPPADILKKIQDRPWKGGFEPVAPDGIALHDAKLVQGKIPEDLEGVLFRNGVGRIRVGDNQYGHWFDGDGLVARLCVSGKTQRATYAAKYVETKRFQLQQRKTSRNPDAGFAAAGAWTKRGKGRTWENILAIPTNPSNTNVIYFEKPGGGIPDIYALAEGGDPVKMDAMTLETHGERSFKSASGESTNSFFSAHYKKDPDTGDVYNHGTILIPTPAVNIMKLDSFGTLIKQAQHDLPTLGFVHDNMLTENYFILLLQPYEAPSAAIAESLFGGEPLGKRFDWNREGQDESIAMIFSKATLEMVAEVSLPLLSFYHHLNAFEEEGGGGVLKFRTLVHDPPESRIDLEKSFSDLYSAPRGPVCRAMVEYTIDVKSNRVVESRRLAPNAAPCELPDMHYAWGYRTKFAYTNPCEDHVEWSNSLQKVNLESGECSDVISFGEGVFAFAPIFVPKQDAKVEDDGYLFTQLYRSHDHGTDVCILDAKSMKTIAILRLEKPVPYSFHGTWYTGAWEEE
jgi:all-trans-8'-apo-beta-carotenal 15,15'-oxygenase